MKEFDAKVKEVKRGMVRELLEQCTPDQIKFFNRMYGSIEKISEANMRHAYRQCKATIAKNASSL